MPDLFGRNWMEAIKLNLGLNILCEPGESAQRWPIKESSVCSQGSFCKDLGTLKGTKTKIYLKEGAQPKFVKARPVP